MSAESPLTDRSAEIGKKDYQLRQLRDEYAKTSQIRDRDQRDVARQRIMRQIADLEGVTGGFDAMSKGSWEVTSSSSGRR